jgi:hypothetical protein
MRWIRDQSLPLALLAIFALGMIGQTTAGLAIAFAAALFLSGLRASGWSKLLCTAVPVLQSIAQHSRCSCKSKNRNEPLASSG